MQCISVGTFSASCIRVGVYFFKDNFWKTFIIDSFRDLYIIQRGQNFESCEVV